MLYEFAIEPDLLAGWRKCQIVLNVMGFQHGRAISGYPSKRRWKELVREAVTKANLPDRERKRVHEKISQIDPKLVRSDRPYDATLQPVNERWLRNAVAQQTSLRPFHAILTTKNPGARDDVIVEEDIDEAHPRLATRPEIPVLRQADHLPPHIRTLVRNSRRLLLVDPHFDPSYYRWQPVVAGCLKLTLDRFLDSPIEAIEIHTLDGGTSFDEFVRRCQNSLTRWRPAGIAPVRVVRWRVREAAHDDFHERYVLTERGGYRIGKGLDEEFGKTQPVALLSDPEHLRIWAGYQDGTALFDKDGEFRFA